MVKTLPLILAVLGSCVLSEALRCCKCSNGKTIDVSYRECKKNNTCEWTCSVKNKCGPLYLDPSVEEGPPNVTSQYWNFYATEGQAFDLDCKIRSNPESNITWLFNGRDIRFDSIKAGQFMKKTINCNPVLTASAALSYNGQYTCLAQNAKGYGYHTINLTVIPSKKIKPHVTDISIDTKDHKAYLGTTFNLSCTVNFNPIVGSVPQIAFLRHGSRVWDVKGKYENFPRVVVNGGLITQKLSLKNVTIAEEGNWSCYGFARGVHGPSKRMTLALDSCPAGYYCPWNESRKHECPYGTYNDGSTNITYHCTKCPGEYPASKPKGYFGPAKSIQECPLKVSVSKQLPPGPKKPLIIGIIAVFSLIVFLLLVGIKFKKQCKQGFRKIISVNNLVSEPELVINDFCANDPEQRLFNLASEIPEFPIRYDVFISYSSKDVTFATEIQRELESQGFKCCIHIRDFIPGDTILNNISNAIYGSRVTLAVLSPDFVESEWCKGELQQALTRSMRDHRVIPILYKNCQIPTELLHRTYIDYENCYVKPYFWEQLRSVLNPIRLTVESNV